MYQSDLTHPALEDKLHQLYTLSGKKNLALELFREPYIQLLEAFGDPHKHLPPVIHVAGTNGKGSIIAMLRSIYEAAGYRVHTYSSPHLIRFNERIVLAGQQIDDAALEALIDEALALNAGRDATFFEATTAMAFAAFSRVPADICLVEVGLGGRLDCTNIIERPALSVINAIGLDHMDYLGDTIEDIAAEKAGIIKRGVPCVVGAQRHDAVYPVFEGIAAERGAELIRAAGTPSSVQSAPFPLGLNGVHQRDNAAVVLEAIEVLQGMLSVDERAIAHGLATARWPARMQELCARSFGVGLGEDVQIWLDGGHNEDAGRAIGAFIEALDAPVYLVCGMLQHKDPKGFLGPILPHVEAAIFTTLPEEPTSLSAQSLMAACDYDGGVGIQTAPDYKAALGDLTTVIDGPAHILIAGSLYLAGAVLRDLENQGHNGV